MKPTQFFSILATIYVAPHVNEKTAYGVSALFVVLAAFCAIAGE